MTIFTAAPTAGNSTLAQVLPPIATVIAAILGALITGFGAATLKHRWDSEADNTRWQRESALRNRAQRLNAFAQYLSARPDLNTVRSLADESGDPTVVVSAIRLAAAHLLILLSDAHQRDIVESDLLTVENWVISWLAPSSAGRTDVPSPSRILDLARQLAVEPDPEPGTCRS
jgi:hypothetical protein